MLLCVACSAMAPWICEQAHVPSCVERLARSILDHKPSRHNLATDPLPMIDRHQGSAPKPDGPRRFSNPCAGAASLPIRSPTFVVQSPPRASRFDNCRARLSCSGTPRAGTGHPRAQTPYGRQAHPREHSCCRRLERALDPARLLKGIRAYVAVVPSALPRCPGRREGADGAARIQLARTHRRARHRSSASGFHLHKHDQPSTEEAGRRFNSESGRRPDARAARPGRLDSQTLIALQKTSKARRPRSETLHVDRHKA
jgi:hypothetical protein